MSNINKILNEVEVTIQGFTLVLRRYFDRNGSMEILNSVGARVIYIKICSQDLDRLLSLNDYDGFGYHG